MNNDEKNKKLKELGAALVQLRESRDMSAYEVSEASGMHQSMIIKKMESGSGNYHALSLLRYFDACGIDLIGEIKKSHEKK